MVSFREFGDDVWCLPQLTPSSVVELAAMGVRSIVCNRPDGETDVIPSQDIAAAAASAGLEFRHLPVTMESISMRDGAEFINLMEVLPKPIAAYCRTGRRSTALWVLGRAPRIGIEAALNAARSQGVTLDGLAPQSDCTRVTESVPAPKTEL